MKVDRLTKMPGGLVGANGPAGLSLLDDWRQLAGEVTMCDSAWLLPWWRHFGPDGEHGNRHYELCLLTVRDDRQQLVGLAPWYLERSLKQGTIIRYLGSGIACTDYLTLLTRGSHEAAVAVAVADWLCGEGKGCWERLELVGTDDEDTVVRQLIEQLAARGHRVHQRPGANTWRLTLPDSWDAYLQSVSSNRRALVRKFLRRELESGLAVLHETNTEQEFAENWAILERLHQARRRSLGTPGVFARPDFAGFLREAGRTLFEQQRLDLLVLIREGIPVAAEFNPLGKQTVWCYQSGIEPAALKHRPGYVMLVARMRRAIARGHTQLDMLRGDEPYKAEWGAAKRTTTEYRVVRRGPLTWLRHGAWLADQSARHWAKQHIKAIAQPKV